MPDELGKGDLKEMVKGQLAIMYERLGEVETAIELLKRLGSFTREERREYDAVKTQIDVLEEAIKELFD